jgi:hypothetical protein
MPFYLTHDPIPALQAFGYTDREAAFLYLVATHSGYFLRRQFDWFIDRNKGSIVSRFVAKARAAGHIEVLDYKQGWYVYHLCSRVIYRLCGDPESQLRRRKADAQVRSRLMALDYILANETDHYLASEAERLHYFEQVRGIPTDFLDDEDRRLHPLLTAFPISLVDRDLPAHSLIRFGFIDEGLSDAGKFMRFLDAAEPLLRAVGSFEVVYIANSESVFPSVKTAFWSRFSPPASRNPGLFGDDSRAAQPPPRSPLDARFTTMLFKHSYPAIQRSKGHGSARVRSADEVEAVK